MMGTSMLSLALAAAVSLGGYPLSKDSHTRMIAELKAIAERGRSDDPYFGKSRMERMRQKLDGLPADVDPLERMRVLYILGNYELLYGETTQAVAHIEQATTLAQHLSSPIHEEITTTLQMSLATAYMRLAEDENCVHCQNGEGCLFPLRRGGVHEFKRGASSAADLFAKVLRKQPGNLTAQWLATIARMALGRRPMSDGAYTLKAETWNDKGFPRFPNAADEMGLDSFSHSGGVAVDDFDGDGLFDVVTSSWNPSVSLRYYRNMGNGRFEDVSKAAGLEGITGGLNLVQCDYDNDGDLDVYVLRGAWLGNYGRHPNSLLENDGAGSFRDVSYRAMLADPPQPTQTANWADLDNDGDLDLYVGAENYGTCDVSCQLFENVGNGTFRDVAPSAGVTNNAFTKGAVWGDYDADGFVDLYVSNITSANRLYRNLGNKTFEDVALEAGVARPLNGFGTWFWDYNNDGVLDLFASSYTSRVDAVASDYFGLRVDSESDALYQGTGKRFINVAQQMDLPRATMPMGLNFGDLDNDGYLDFYLGTGATGLQSLVPNVMMRNDQGQRFVNVTTAGGFGHLQKGHGIAFADLDADGDQDVFAQMGGAYRADAFHDAVFRNPGNDNHRIVLKLVGRKANRNALQTRVRLDVVSSGQRRRIFRWVCSGGSFGANPLQLDVGLGSADTVEQIQILWAGSQRAQTLEPVKSDQSVVILEPR